VQPDGGSGAYLTGRYLDQIAQRVDQH
jgi:hypothetical protein